MAITAAIVKITNRFTISSTKKRQKCRQMTTTHIDKSIPVPRTLLVPFRVKVHNNFGKAANRKLFDYECNGDSEW